MTAADRSVHEESLKDQGSRFQLAIFFVFLYVCFYFIDGHNFNSILDAQVREQGIGAARAAAGEAEGGMLRQLSFLLLGLIGFVLMLKPAVDRTRGGHLVGALALVFIIWSVSSVAWADSFGMTVRRLVTFLFPALAALALARHWSMARIVTFVFVATAIPAAIGILAELYHGLQTSALLASTGFGARYRGIAHPNETGSLLSILVLAAICLLALRPTRRAWLLLAALCAFVLLIWTGSRGAMAGLAAGLLVWGLYRRPFHTMLLVGLATLIGAPLLIFVYGEQIVEAVREALFLGRIEDIETFTGRIPVWVYLSERYISERPIFGVGYGGFWSTQRILDVSANIDWGIIVYSHNGLLEVALDLGLVGAALVIIVVIAAFFRALRLYRLSARPEWLFAAAMMAWLVATSIPDAVVPYAGLRTFIVFLVIAKIVVGGVEVPRPAPAWVVPPRAQARVGKATDGPAATPAQQRGPAR